MKKTIRALPNQSLLDLVIMEYGSLEAGMQFALENNVDISMLPVSGDEFTVPVTDAGMTDPAVLSYLRQNAITIGTRGPVPPLGYEIVLKPVMQVVPNVIGNPHTLGYYSYDLVATHEFINANGLVSSYLSPNKVMFETEERYITGHPPAITAELYAFPMADKKIAYKLNWTVGFGYMMVWSDLSDTVNTVTFKDISGNEAYVAPLVVLDNISQEVIDYLVPDISVEVVSASANLITLRLTHSHAPIFLADFSHFTMEWLGDAIAATPDPDDPGNANKRLMTVPDGNYTIGVKTTYEYPGVAHYPSSAFTMVIKVA